MIISALLMLAFPRPRISEEEIIRMARDRGMVYADEVKAFYDKK